MRWVALVLVVCLAGCSGSAKNEATALTPVELYDAVLTHAFEWARDARLVGLSGYEAYTSKQAREVGLHPDDDVGDGRAMQWEYTFYSRSRGTSQDMLVGSDGTLRSTAGRFDQDQEAMRLDIRALNHDTPDVVALVAATLPDEWQRLQALESPLLAYMLVAEPDQRYWRVTMAGFTDGPPSRIVFVDDVTGAVLDAVPERALDAGFEEFDVGDLSGEATITFETTTAHTSMAFALGPPRSFPGILVEDTDDVGTLSGPEGIVLEFSWRAAYQNPAHFERVADVAPGQWRIDLRADSTPGEAAARFEWCSPEGYGSSGNNACAAGF